MLCALLVQTMPPPLQINLDHRNGRQHTNTRNNPSDDLDGLDLVAQRHASLDLALELVKIVRDTCIGTFNVAPDLVDEHTRDDPEDGGDDEEDLLDRQ